MTTPLRENTKKRILIVDDMAVNLQISKDILDNNLSNIICDTAISGMEAIELVKKQHYHCIFMDLQMPVMGGFAATKKIKEINSEIPVIAYTSQVSKESMEKAKEAGIDHYITKPISHGILVRTAAKWLPEKHISNFKEEDVKKTLANKRVISADDQKVNNLILSKDLQHKFNLKIDLVEDGESLVQKFQDQLQKGQPYDLILTDIHMDPKMGGVEAATKIREYEIKHDLQYSVPIIAITGDDEPKLIHNFYRNGIDDYYKKGTTDPDLLGHLMAFWIEERGDRKIHRELLSTKIVQGKEGTEECQYYDNDYDNIRLLNGKLDDKDLMEVRDLFLQSSNELILKIIDCYKKDDVQKFGINVHALKGIAGNIGAERLYRFSHNLNEATKEVDLISDACMEKLEDVFAKTKDALQDICK